MIVGSEGCRAVRCPVPSHAAPPELNRALRRASRRRARGRALGVVFPGVPVVVALAVYGNGRQEHAGILYYFISTLVVLACVAGSVLAFLAATKVASTSVRRRPRWLYALFALGYAAPVALFARAALQHARAHTMNEGGWVPMAAGMAASYCVIAGLFMLGRALAWGRARRSFWILPPMWLEHVPLDRQEHVRQVMP
jgi:hypothetical protein